MQLQQDEDVDKLREMYTPMHNASFALGTWKRVTSKQGRYRLRFAFNSLSTGRIRKHVDARRLQVLNRDFLGKYLPPRNNINTVEILTK